MGSRWTSRWVRPPPITVAAAGQCRKSIANQAAIFSAAPTAIEQVPPSPVLSLVQQPVLSVIPLSRFYGEGVAKAD